MKWYTITLYVLVVSTRVTCLDNDEIKDSRQCPLKIEFLKCPVESFCLNGGTCYTEVNKREPVYYCKCKEKYFGDICQFRRSRVAKTCLLNIENHFCLNGGTCYQQTINNQIMNFCECRKDFWGLRCELRVPEDLKTCLSPIGSRYCENGGTCYECGDGSENKYYCVCPEGYSGLNCQFELREDNSSAIIRRLFCLNQGICNRITWEDVVVFHCSCPEGFHGERCERTMFKTEHFQCSDEASYFCFNGGTCYKQLFGHKIIYLCKCAPGFIGQRCEIELPFEGGENCPEIAAHFCTNGGTCFQLTHMKKKIFYCQCLSGFWGVRCEKKVPIESVCSPPFDKEICENNGTCISLTTGKEHGAYMCKCPEGYYGTTCEYKEPYLDTTDDRCPSEIETWFCLNGGMCHKNLTAPYKLYYCECVKPYYGIRCEFKASDDRMCPPDMNELCFSGGVCKQVKLNTFNIYLCECREGFYGARCEHCHMMEHELACPKTLPKDLCKNGGACIVVKLGEIDSYFCKCAEGFYGMSCEYPYSISKGSGRWCPPELDKSYCLNGGKCYKDETLGHSVYVCECSYPFSGERCELMSDQTTNCPQTVSDKLCFNGGLCSQRKSNGYDVYYCECLPEYYGGRCEYEVKDYINRKCPHSINENLCKNGGTCLYFYSKESKRKYYFCRCPPGFFGLSCEFMYSSSVTENNSCPRNLAEYYCKNGGECHIFKINGYPTYYCNCSSNYYGARCEFQFPRELQCSGDFLTHLCLNGGSCAKKNSNGQNAYWCECLPGYYGGRCEFNEKTAQREKCPHPFEEDLCMNNGTCVVDNTSYYCLCTEGFYGSSCEYQYDPSLKNFELCQLDVIESYCLNGGTCYRHEIMGQPVSFCECVEPFYGTRCEYKQSRQLMCPLQFEKLLCKKGTCIQRKLLGYYVFHCQCGEGYYGIRCEHKADETLSEDSKCPIALKIDLCANGGTCVAVTVGSGETTYFCKCAKGYYGTSCQYKAPLSEDEYCPLEIASIWCLNGGTCYKKFVGSHPVYHCECIPPFYGERCAMKPFKQFPCPQLFSKSLCLHGGLCIPVTLRQFTVYSCQCKEGYYGARCESYHSLSVYKEPLCPPPLNTDLCKNGGTCIKTLRGIDVIYYCKCPEGLYGISCEYPYPHLPNAGDTCEPDMEVNYCLNGGTCYKQSVVGHPIYHCNCIFPYHGQQCEMKNPVQKKCPSLANYYLCINGGTCIEGQSNGYKLYFCLCSLDFYGPRCEHCGKDTLNSIVQCPTQHHNELCKNGGTCIKIIKYTENETSIPTTPCTKDDNCTPITTDSSENEIYFCQCPVGYYGLSCEFQYLVSEKGSKLCPSLVAEIYCFNGGTCYMYDTRGVFEIGCKCSSNYHGKRCELGFPKQLSCPYLLQQQLCLNGGTCIQLKTTSYHIHLCLCAEHFYGLRCEHSGRELKQEERVCPRPLNSVLCQNGGTCIALSLAGGHEVYLCKCTEGYYGLSCDYKEPPFDAVGKHCSPLLLGQWCLNGGTCYEASIRGLTLYYCQCVPPYFGQRCELKSSTILSCPHLLEKVLCINGGHCTQRIVKYYSKEVYYCDCADAYSGARCENHVHPKREVKYCQADLSRWFCSSHGACLEENINSQIIYHCDCKKGYMGERCEGRIIGKQVHCPEEYQDVFCLNGGTCYLIESENSRPYCMCQEGYVGQRCEFKEPRNKDACPNSVSDNLCLNGGVCFQEVISQQKLYSCECPEQFFGLRCEFKSPTGRTCPYPLDEGFCMNSGTCSLFEFESYTVCYCKCAANYYGPLCQYWSPDLPVKFCSPEISKWYCFNGGICHQKILSDYVDFYCVCSEGYYGLRCEYSRPEKTKSCAVNVALGFCLNGGTCVEAFVERELFYYCECPENFSGKRCEYFSERIDSCPPALNKNLCLNDGSCHVITFSSYIIYYCECQEDYFGPRCEGTAPSVLVKTDCPAHIEPHFCLNGGTCRQSISQKVVIYYCLCTEDYWGERCEFSYSQHTNCSQIYDQFYCLNCGTCYQLAVGNTVIHHCECANNFFGNRCELSFPTPGPFTPLCSGSITIYYCFNGGTCYQKDEANEIIYFCDCPDGYSGLRCEHGPVLKQECPPKLSKVFCLNNGICKAIKFEGREMYYCKCVQGFEGPRCEYSLPSSELAICPAGAGEMYCLNGGTCSQITVLEEKFLICKCPEGFWGRQCEFSRFVKNLCPQPLDESLCLNGGTCFQLLLDDKDIYYCECTLKHYGMRCENTYVSTRGQSRKCSQRVTGLICLNGGTCYQFIKGEKMVYYCECPNEYFGTRCELNVGEQYIKQPAYHLSI